MRALRTVGGEGGKTKGRELQSPSAKGAAPEFPQAESSSQVSMLPISSSILVFSISRRSIIHAVAALSLMTEPAVTATTEGGGR